MCVFKRHDVPADILQRPHPVPVSRDTIECQSQTFRRRGIEVEWIRTDWLGQTRFTRIDHADEPDRHGQGHEYYYRQQDVLSHLKFLPLKIIVAAANSTVM